jgi:hypothetical protein
MGSKQAPWKGIKALNRDDRSFVQDLVLILLIGGFVCTLALLWVNARWP